MKKGDIVKFKVGITEDVQKGRVNWVNKGNVGITLIGDKYSGAEATVMPEKDCELVVEFKGGELRDKIHGMSTKKLIASIQRLKTMRLPRRISRRVKASTTPSRRQRMTRLLEVLEDNPDALDGLIEKALKEEKDEQS